ncbi:MAG: hypothetical protein OXI15_07495 [Chromatiales bacterium]|nr:hypothetical protein [Chromatiales bacterium]
MSGDGLHDRLIEFSRADTGSYLFAPGERALAEATGFRADLPISERNIRPLSPGDTDR